MEKEIYIILSNSGTVPGKLVSRMTHFYYSHVMLSLHPDCREMYSFGRRSVRNFLNGGFVVEQPNGAFFTRFSETQCRILSLTVMQEQFQQLERALDVFISNAREYRYDFIGCGLRYFRLRKTFDQRYTCSHFVAEMLDRCEICRFPNGTMMARPEDFTKIPGVHTVYEGKLQDLNKTMIWDDRRINNV